MLCWGGWHWWQCDCNHGCRQQSEPLLCGEWPCHSNCGLVCAERTAWRLIITQSGVAGPGAAFTDLGKSQQ